MSNWISVKDRLPEEEAGVLVYPPVMSCSYNNEYGFYRFSTSQDCEVACRGITHWMPLPEAPKESTDD